MVQHYSIRDGLSQNTVMAILQDKQGFMWFGTWDGLNRFDGYTFTVYKAMKDGVKVSVNNRVEQIYEDAQEQIWWMTYDGHYYRLDATRKHTTEQPFDSLPAGMKEQIAEADAKTAVDSHHIIWQADDQAGIMRYRDGAWKRFTPEQDPRYAGQLREHFMMLEDAKGRTWVNPTGGGWSYYDYDQDALVYPIDGLTNMIHTAYIDRDGQMWVATYDGGVDCINMDPVPYELHDCRYQTNNGNGKVRAFCQDKNGQAYPLFHFYCALESRHGRLFGTKGNGLLLNGKHIPTSHNDIYDIEEDEDGTLYVATYGGGVNIIRWEEDLHQWSKPIVVGDGLKVRDIEIVDGTLWCGTTNGILRIPIGDFRLEIEDFVLMPSYDIRAVHYSQGLVWLGSFGGGLLYIDPKDTTNEIRSVETYHDIILAMTGDEENLWFCSENDIAQLEFKTGNLYYYDALEGEENTCFSEAEAVRQADGKIFFGYSKGYCTIDPALIVRSNRIPPLRITHVESKEGELEGETVTIEHGSNITIEYAAMNFIGTHKIYYSYKMDGVDADWLAPTDTRRVTYSNLRYGTYVFHVRSTNQEGGDVENEQTLIICVRRPIWLSWWAITLYIVAVVLFLVLTFFAISTYNKLRRKVQVEQQVTDIKLRFFTNISHELRTPLTLITAPVENILQTERISHSVRSQLEIVQSNSQRMLRMVNQLLEFRKVQNQKMKLKVQQTLLSSLVAETCENFRKEADDKHIRFEIIEKAEDSTVWVDRQRMDTILWNLLSNAFKFTPAGKSIRVIIDSKPGFVTLQVQDEGIGIAPEKRSVLFERFSSNNELNNTSVTGTGIGMNLTKELVDLHHGYIEVESEIGKGTTFTVLLHTGKEHFGSEVEFIADDRTAVSQTTAFENKIEQLEQEQDQDTRHTILVVDDNQGMRSFLTNILSKDYHVIAAEDGKEAERIVKTQSVKMVITDLMMPKIDGLELTQFIKSNPELDFIPVILLTAKTAIESRLQAMQYGADEYLTKPFEPEYLRARVRNLLQQREQLEHSYRQRLMRLETQPTDETIPGDAFLAKLLQVMDEQMDNNTLTVDALVDEMRMGRTVFFNKLKSMTGLSPVEFIREMRLKRAAQLLEEHKYNITEVTYMVGMNDSRYFAKCFKNTYGVTPSEYRKNAWEREANG